jgi:hypothetical protein
MSFTKFRIFKCKKPLCYCGGSWIVARGGWALAKELTHAEAIAAVDLVTGQAAA